MKSLMLVMVVVVAAAVQGSFALVSEEALAPLSSYLPDSEDPCKSVNCGNGTCVNTTDYPFVKCECNAGWKQPSYGDELHFKPCVIPNCTIDYGCSSRSMSPAAAPSPSHSKTSDNPFDPCNYDICGGGQCVLKSNATRNTTFQYECKCFEGYANVKNSTWGFCAKECELQRDCSRIGISLSNDSTAGTDDSSNYAHGGLNFITENGGLVSGSILATLIVLLFQ